MEVQISVFQSMQRNKFVILLKITSPSKSSAHLQVHIEPTVQGYLTNN